MHILQPRNFTARYLTQERYLSQMQSGTDKDFHCIITAEKSLRHHKCPSTRKWADKLCSIYTTKLNVLFFLEEVSLLYSVMGNTPAYIIKWKKQIKRTLFFLNNRFNSYIFLKSARIVFNLNIEFSSLERNLIGEASEETETKAH